MSEETTPAATPVEAPVSVPPKPQAEVEVKGPDMYAHFETKIETLHRELKTERDALKELKKSYDTTAQENSAFKLQEKKSSAWIEVISTLGEDFEIPSEKSKSIKAIIDRLPDSEDLSDVMKGLADTAKVSKMKPAAINAPFYGSAAGGQASTPAPTSNTELFQLAHTDPAAFLKLMGSKK